MRSELLAFKYKDLILSSQITERKAIDLGWKIRKKYLRHAKDEETKESLQAFADIAVEEGFFKIEGLAYANEALLQAQKWRYDPDNFSIDPPHKSAWDKVQGLLNASINNPRLVVSYLRENIDFNIDFKSEYLFSMFLRALLLNLISEASKEELSDIGALSSIENYKDFITTILIKLPKIIELKVLAEATDIKNALDFMGFSNINEIKDFSQFGGEVEEKESFVFDLLPMASDVLFRASNIGNIIHIHLNSRNGFIIDSYKSDEKKQLLHRFMKAYVVAINYKSTTDEQMKYFNSYLALSLNREFS